jgi:aldehyde dehydrogenase (NAD+)
MLTLPQGALLVDGELLTTGADGTYDHINPHTGQIQATVPVGGAADIDRAVQSARAAFPSWRAWSPASRRDVLLRLAGLIRDRGQQLADITTHEMGMVRTFAVQACSDLPVEYFTYYAGWCEKLLGEVIPTFPGDALDYTLLTPYGVVGAIIGWNGPMGSIGMKIAPALAAGNCVVLKPPEITPFTPVMFGELCIEAGIPPGVVNVVPGGVSAGEALARHSGVDKLTFTGGTATAGAVLDAARENLTPVVLELGGKSANIVFDDADMPAALGPSGYMGAVALSGQACSLPTRLLLHDDIYDEAIEAVIAGVSAVRLGDPSHATTMMGPLASGRQLERVLGIIKRATSDGSGTLLYGGEHVGGDLAGGFYLKPTVFGDVDPASSLAQDEVFGPVLTVIRFKTEEEAVEIANQNRYGLAGYVWTKDVKRAHRVARALEAGFVSVNGFAMNPPNAPFGGWKSSGWGKEGGFEGIAEFLRTKNVYVVLD